MSLDYAKVLENILIDMEGRIFDKHFQFTTIGYCNQLHTSIMDGGWKEVEGFRDWSGMGAFADDLNAAIQPVVDKHAALIKQDLANELIKIVAEG